MTRTAFAAAKVNLYLHVAPPTPDGYHPIASLMAFADVGDTVAGSPAPELSLEIGGPFGEGLSAGPDNLVLRAVSALLARAGRPDAGARLVLTKALPIAAGLGGGSSPRAGASRSLRQRASHSAAARTVRSGGGSGRSAPPGAPEAS